MLVFFSLADPGVLINRLALAFSLHVGLKQPRNPRGLLEEPG